MHTSTQLNFSRAYRIANEVANAITHGIGFIAAIVATILLVRKGMTTGSTLAVPSYAIYGASMIALYLTSTIYHSLRMTRAAKVLRICDHACIFLLIAGTYTPVSLLAIGGNSGLLLTVAIWALAIIGMIMKIGWLEKSKRISTLIYILMGWLVVLFLKPFYDGIAPLGFWLIVAGGLTYTFGTLFYRMKDRRFTHVIWHLFVLAGSVNMFLGIYFGV